MLKIDVQLNPPQTVSKIGRRQETDPMLAQATGQSDKAETNFVRSTAWLLPGPLAVGWLNEIATWNLPHQHLRFLILPTSMSDRSPTGALVYFDSSANSGKGLNQEAAQAGERDPLTRTCISPAPTCIEYWGWLDRLWIPHGATLNHPVSAIDFDAIRVPNLTYIWHPKIGLIGIDDVEILRCSQLLRLPREEASGWDRGVAGPKFNKRLYTMRSSPPAHIDETLAEGKEDIGAQADQISWKPQPRKPITAKEVFSGKVNPVLFGIARIVRAMTKIAPATASQETWINRWEKWANDRLRELSDQLFRERNKELLRLMDLLDNDPDQGLKFALPIDSVSSHRGLEHAGGELGKREIDFDYGKLTTPRAQDVWEIPARIRHDLHCKYRNLAAREVSLGRYRRAAYIYAHLLADLPAAARALEAGKHFREAAVIYRSHLKDDLTAIRCLKSGGLWSEAIELLEQREDFEQIGDILAKIGQPENAIQFYLRATDQFKHRDELIHAARIEEYKLGEPDLALKTLSSGFSKGKSFCLPEIFRILGNKGGHQVAQTWLEKARTYVLEYPRTINGVAETVIRQATEYPDQATRELAADTARKIVSQYLAGNRPSTEYALIKNLSKLAPADRLLSRDCGRVVNDLSPKRKSTTRPRSSRRQPVTLHRSLVLDENRELWGRLMGQPPPANSEPLSWVTAHSIRDTVFALGYCHDIFVIQRFDWRYQSFDTRCFYFSRPVPPDGLTANDVIIASNRENFVAIFISNRLQQAEVPLATRLTDLSFSSLVSTELIMRTELMPSFTLGKPAGVTQEVLGLQAISNREWLQLRLQNNSLLLEIVGSGNPLTSTVSIALQDLPSFQIPVPICVLEGKFLLGIGNRSFVISSVDRKSIDFDQLICGIATSPPYTRLRVGMALDNGIAYFKDHIDASNYRILCSEMERPHMLFTRSGHLVAATDNHCQIFSTRDDLPALVGELTISESLALLPTNAPNEFATITKRGEVKVYQIARAIA
ncbi:MAG TPA: hypothetical protein PKD64_13280 [Pirellulaceae bacterium]|nr:hypothetical protein [Pirellulaceae bacterium]HMO93159.1 hypothetical protein [Pirellulaceae bacterium]HMP70012.1 hypothetical protein [Pirellulaceae bacterium]